MAPQSPPIRSGLLDAELALSQIGDEDAMQDMLVLLQESLARDVPEITAMLQSGDLIGANRLLHGLKGFIPIFCNEEFCEQVVRVEAMSKVPVSPDLAMAYANLRPHLEKLLAEVSAHLGSRANGA